MMSVPIKATRLFYPVQSERATARVAAELTVTSIGIALVLCAVLANESWFDHHFLPTFFAPFGIYIVAARVGRILLGIVGAAVLLHVRPRFGRLVVRTTTRRLAADMARILLAVLLA